MIKNEEREGLHNQSIAYSKGQSHDSGKKPRMENESARYLKGGVRERSEKRKLFHGMREHLTQGNSH